jgi:hypothetical protein
MDYLMRMYGAEEDPLKSGDTRSWFLFYKWMVEGEAHFDVPENDVFYGEIQAGDRLWFSMDRELIGYVEVLRAQVDPTRDMLEIWYDGQKCFKYTFGQSPQLEDFGTRVPDEVAHLWMGYCKEAGR